ncbi:sporulation protein [Pontibacter qinzhouensis]|uniref:Sporulation protein n=1 Tax=Pontibacter qinzhouensis TaxID=2603253 RepID=A0A5C8KBX6_9BACT|nr:sporulation protein [Pontibacter qinzhouensis]TXK50871.1 sporulation protein [Pontibacter qinzhouensis]
MNKVSNLLFALLFLVLAACGSSSRTSTSDAGRATGKTRAAEDLSEFRPTYPDAEATGSNAAAPLTPTNHVNNRVAALMDTVASVNRNVKYAQGFRILAYNGSERQTVMDLRKAIIARVPQEKDYLTYQQPNFRLKIGDYFSRIEAQQVLNQIRDLLPNAQIVSDQININK